jgi:drug/metabolite transporter (DMT)-like permease
VKPQPSYLLPSLAVATCGALWGIYWLPLHWFDSQGVGGGWVSVIFSAVCMLAPLPWLLSRKSWEGFGNEAITGLVLGTGFSLYTVSLVLTDVVNSILLFYLTPIWSTLAARLLFGTHLSVQRMAAIVLGFLGMGFVLGGKGQLPIPHNAGDCIALLSGMMWSFGSLRSYAKPHSGIAVPVFCFALGGFVSSLAILAYAASTTMPLAATGGLPTLWPWIILLALIIFVPPNFLVLWASQRIDPGRVGILLMTEVLVGSLSAAFLSGESFGWAKALGAAMIVGAGLTEVLSRAPQAKR